MAEITKLGRVGEDVANDYLCNLGFVVHERNWRTRYCEIDIVAQKQQRIYFVEVKSRSTNDQGFGSDYITPKKLRQMKFAAEIWVQTHDWRGEYQLAVISVDPGGVTFIDDIC